MPHDPVLVRSEIVSQRGMHDFVLEERYEAPATEQNTVAHDPHKGSDAALAANMMKWLNREYPGHLWGVVADQAQGIVKFNLPILMGFKDYWVINLHTHDIVDSMANGAGQILERYGLKRGKFELGSFLEARHKHSILVQPGRKVPG